MRLRSTRTLVTIGAVVLAGIAITQLPGLLANPVDDPGGGPPDASVVLPFEEHTFLPLVIMSMPTGDPCAWLTEDAMSDIVGSPVSSHTDTDGCTWSGGPVRLAITVIDQPLTAAFPDLAENWADYPEVVTDPVNGLFFHEGTEAALLLDAGQSTVVIHATQAGGDRRELLDMLITVAEALAG